MKTVLNTILDYQQSVDDEKCSIMGTDCFVSGYAKIMNESGKIIDGVPIFDIPGTKKYTYLIERLENRLNHPENYTVENIEENIARLDKAIYNRIQLGILSKSVFQQLR